jgi:hypothetical protein
MEPPRKPVACREIAKLHRHPERPEAVNSESGVEPPLTLS